MTQQDIHDFMTANFTCANGLEHRIGQDALDSGHGARPVGPQICIRCGKTLAALLRQLTLEARRDEELNLGFDKRLDDPILFCRGDEAIARRDRVAELNNQLSKDKEQ